MKQYFLSLLFVVTSGVIFAQTEKSIYAKSNDLEIVIVPKIGFATYKETGYVPLNGFINGGDVLVSIKMNKKINLVTGVGYFEFDGNRNTNTLNSNLQNSYFHIPLTLKSDIVIFKDKSHNENIFFELGFGLYANSLFMQKIETIDYSYNSKNVGWNFGFSTQMGMKFIMSEVFNLGIGFESQNDFTKISHNNEKIEGGNAINLSFGFTI
jgi:hypothetical protein